MGIPQVAGRDFADSDTVDSLPVAIVSEELVRQQFPDGSPFGRRLRINVDHANGRDDVEWTIVGVVGNTRSSLDGACPPDHLPPAGPSVPAAHSRSSCAREQDPLSLTTSVTATFMRWNGKRRSTFARLDDVVGSTIARPRAISVLLGVFALVALGLAAVGVYGVMAYSVRERTQEIGVRMALGATSQSVFRLVLGHALRLVSIGVVAGLVAAGALTRLLERLLFQVEPLDPWTFAATRGRPAGVATIASYVPARRGMQMAPVEALRTN